MTTLRGAWRREGQATVHKDDEGGGNEGIKYRALNTLQQDSL